MELYDNPAGRLYELLRRLSEVSRSVSVLSAWAQVLNVPEGEVPLHLGRVGQLVAEVQEAVGDGGDPLVATVHRYRDEWSGAIFPRSHALDAPLKPVLPSDAAVEALGVIATHLHSVAREGNIPDEDELAKLKASIQELLEDIERSEDVPDDVKQLLVSRVMEVLRAIEHVAVGGPNAVRLATEALVGGMVALRQPGLLRTQTVKRVMATLGAVWFAFTAAPTVQHSVEAWGDLFRGELTPGVPQEPEQEEPEPPK